MKNPILDFAKQFNAEIEVDEELIVEKGGRYFLLTEAMRRLVKADFFFAGTYLGKFEKGKFFPSFSLLKIIARKQANKILVDEKTEWLFICGRDVFRQGIIEAQSQMKEDEYVLVMNRFDECVGFGKTISNLDKHEKGMVVENLSDLGDFLRRER